MSATLPNMNDEMNDVAPNIALISPISKYVAPSDSANMGMKMKLIMYDVFVRNWIVLSLIGSTSGYVYFKLLG